MKAILIIFLILAALLLGSGLWWRHASRRYSLPCPWWLAWLLESSVMEKFGRTQKTLDRIGLRPGQRVLEVGPGPGRVVALKQCYAALKPGGVLSITEIYPDPHYQSRSTVSRLAQAAGFRFDWYYGSWLWFTMNFVKPERNVPTFPK
ncbi:MAG: hypothetical protein C4576_03150 [Desulfobacteraceae bacterium]|nr:MAG: hypothetical protein C4576_03150 [Desulfobacteraceae bacterium]